MKGKRFNNNGRGFGRRGRGGNRGRGRGMRRGAYADGWEDAPGPRRGWRRGPWNNSDDADFYGPPPWAPRWGQEAFPEADGAIPPGWGAGRRWWEDMTSGESRQAWLEARKARLQAWKQHLEERLAETEAELNAASGADEEAE